MRVAGQGGRWHPRASVEQTRIDGVRQAGSLQADLKFRRGRAHDGQVERKRHHVLARRQRAAEAFVHDLGINTRSDSAREEREEQEDLK
jgi:hypothetical protein